MNRKNNFNTLIKNFWVFSILLALSEMELLYKLFEKASLKDLATQANVESAFLKKMLTVLLESSYITYVNGYYSLNLDKLGITDQGSLDSLIARLQVTFGQANALITDIDNGNFKCGWHYENKKLLQAQGKISEYVVIDLFENIPQLKNSLSQKDANLLDIGAGVGKISLKFCEKYPMLQVFSVEPADIPFSLACENITNTVYADRIDLKKIYAHELKEINIFDVVWLPQFFISDDHFSVTLETIYRSLKPGGFLFTVAGIQDDDQCSVRQFVRALYGYDRPLKILIEDIEKAGFKTVEVLPKKNSIIPVIARKGAL